MSTARSSLTLLTRPEGEIVEIDKPSFLIGRHHDADLQLPRNDVSRRHCRLLWDDGTWSVVDLSSTNGTYVNGQRVDQAVLSPGDRLRIAGVEFDVPAEAA